MMYKVIYEVTEAQMKNLKLSPNKITPVYKTLDDDLTDELDWIDYWEKMILDTSCEFVWDRYYDDFHDKKILSKNLFYKLIHQTLGCHSKQIRLTRDTTKYCFVRKST